MGFLSKLFGLLRPITASQQQQPRQEPSYNTHNERMGALLAHPENNVVKCLTYFATLQLRTPLRILLKDGEKQTEGTPPEGDELWHGIWVPETKSWRELGFDIDELPEGSFSSEIGTVKHSEYLPFLIEVRKAVESSGGIAEKISLLRSVCREPHFVKFVKRHGGQGKIIDYFFPPVVNTISGINSGVVAALLEAKINTIGKIKKRSDKELLALKGIGPSAVQKLRDFCNSYGGDDKAERVENLREQGDL